MSLLLPLFFCYCLLFSLDCFQMILQTIECLAAISLLFLNETVITSSRVCTIKSYPCGVHCWMKILITLVNSWSLIELKKGTAELREGQQTAFFCVYWKYNGQMLKASISSTTICFWSYLNTEAGRLFHLMDLDAQIHSLGLIFCN